jgi:hypothetical protein
MAIHRHKRPCSGRLSGVTYDHPREGTSAACSSAELRKNTLAVRASPARTAVPCCRCLRSCLCWLNARSVCRAAGRSRSARTRTRVPSVRGFGRPPQGQGLIGRIVMAGSQAKGSRPAKAVERTCVPPRRSSLFADPLPRPDDHLVRSYLSIRGLAVFLSFTSLDCHGIPIRDIAHNKDVYVTRAQPERCSFRRQLLGRRGEEDVR